MKKIEKQADMFTYSQKLKKTLIYSVDLVKVDYIRLLKELIMYNNVYYLLKIF